MEQEGSLPCLQEPTIVPYAPQSNTSISSTLMLHLKGRGHVAHLNLFIYDIITKHLCGIKIEVKLVTYIVTFAIKSYAQRYIR
jgi:hypothetical protein